MRHTYCSVVPPVKLLLSRSCCIQEHKDTRRPHKLLHAVTTMNMRYLSSCHCVVSLQESIFHMPPFKIVTSPWIRSHITNRLRENQNIHTSTNMQQNSLTQTQVKPVITVTTYQQLVWCQHGWGYLMVTLLQHNQWTQRFAGSKNTNYTGRRVQHDWRMNLRECVGGEHIRAVEQH